MGVDAARERIQRLLVTGDNRLKQGVDPAKARASYEQALEAAREAGLEDTVRPLVEIRLADLERLERESPPDGAPGH
jgi:predicted negative regulator of RcsB-dependent stress response